MNIKKTSITLLALACVVALTWYLWGTHLTQSIPIAPKKPLVGILLSDLTSAQRWNIEAVLLRTRLEADGFQVEVLDAHGDGGTQVAQMREMTSKGAKGLIVVAANANALGRAMVEAHDKGVKIIAYDRIMRRGPVDRYMTVDMTESGRLEFAALTQMHPGAKFLYLGGDPGDENATLHRNGLLVAAGERVHEKLPVMVGSLMAPSWDSSLAYDYVKKEIASSTDFSAVIAGNDGLAGAAIDAARNAGKKLSFVGGSDGDIDACARVRSGEQTVTIMKPFRDLAGRAVAVLEELIKGNEPKSDTTTDNGYAAIETVLIAPVLIDKNNITPDVTKCTPK